MSAQGTTPVFDFGGGTSSTTAVPVGSAAAPTSGGAAPPPDGQTIPVQAESGGYKGLHPIAAFFHVVFKIAALLVFILGGIFSMGYVLLLIVTVLLLAADFWTTKNVTGRLLVCMRWWNTVTEDGSTQWVFESCSDAEQRVSAYDSWFFWVTTGGNCAVWLVLAFVNILSISKLPIAITGLMLSGANFLGYFKCRRDAKNKVTAFMLTQAARPEVANQVASFFSGSEERK